MRAESTMGSTMKTTATLRKLFTGLAALLAVGVATERAEAQEILLTGPLAGAPAVRKLRLYREKRIEVAPAASFTLLDEYQREIFFGARVNYNLTDWLAIGAFGGFGAVKLPTGLSEKIQDVNDKRRKTQAPDTTDRRLTAVNLGPDFKDQLGTMDWVIAPQLTGVPFRGKLALFQNIYLDTDLYFFAGPAFIGVSERKNCDTNAGTAEPDCSVTFDKQSRVAIAPTFGLGFTFYANKWNALGFEWRALPFSWNTGGFDTKGGGKDKEFPDNKIDDQDRQFRFNQMLTVSWNFYFPQEYRVSE
jgi:outer membrane beta-barrel protein